MVVSIPVEMSNMSELSIQIVMIYDSNMSSQDNVVYIRKNLETNEYVIRYMDPNGGKPFVHELSSLYYQKALDYVYYLMKNQYLDEEGFLHFQVNLPGMPSMIVTGDKFKDIYYRDHFYDLLGFGLGTLETASRVHVPKTMNPVAAARMVAGRYKDYEDGEVPQPRHEFFD